MKPVFRGHLNITQKISLIAGTWTLGKWNTIMRKCPIGENVPSEKMSHWRKCPIRENVPSEKMSHRRKCSIGENVPSEKMFHWRKCPIGENVLLEKMFHWRKCPMIGGYPVIWNRFDCIVDNCDVCGGCPLIRVMCLLIYLQYLCESLHWSSVQDDAPIDWSENSTLQLLYAWRNLMLVLSNVSSKVSTYQSQKKH